MQSTLTLDDSIETASEVSPAAVARPSRVTARRAGLVVAAVATLPVVLVLAAVGAVILLATAPKGWIEGPGDR